MDEEKRKSRAVIINEWIVLTGFVCILFGGCVITYFITIENINSCTSDPLKYYSNKILNNENISYSSAHILFFVNKSDEYASKTVDIDLPLSNKNK